MRSVVVVLPASMCAMIPMLRVFLSVNLRGIGVVWWGQGKGCFEKRRPANEA